MGAAWNVVSGEQYRHHLYKSIVFNKIERYQVGSKDIPGGFSYGLATCWEGRYVGFNKFVIFAGLW